MFREILVIKGLLSHVCLELKRTTKSHRGPTFIPADIFPMTITDFQVENVLFLSPTASVYVHVIQREKFHKKLSLSLQGTAVEMVHCFCFHFQLQAECWDLRADWQTALQLHSIEVKEKDEQRRTRTWVKNELHSFFSGSRLSTLKCALHQRFTAPH